MIKKKGRKKKRRLSLTVILLQIVILLSLLGLFFVFEASTVESFRKYGHQYHFLKSQGFWLIIGWLLAMIGYALPTKFWQQSSLFLYIFNIILLVMVFVPGIGVKINGARRWIFIAGKSFQPVELLKFTLIIFFSSWLPKHQNLETMLFFLLIPVFLLMLQPDLGSTLIILAIGFSLYFFSGADLGILIKVVALGVLVLVISIISSSYRMNRVKTFLNPDFDPSGKSFHIRQIMLALGSGGLFGLGIGNSTQKTFYLPEASSDSIFAIIAEEIGFIGSLTIVLLFLLLIFLCYRVALTFKQRSFEKFLAAGIMVWLAAQTLMNLAAVVVLVPLTGVPLPFFSSGGSSLVTLLLAMGVLLRLSRKANQ